MTTPELLLAATLIIFSAWCLTDIRLKVLRIRKMRDQEAWHRHHNDNE